MALCSRCGKELTEGAGYCIYCGTRVGGPGYDRRWERDWERSWRRQRRERDGWWGAVSAFGFLIIIGLAVSRFPDVFSLLGAYLTSWGTHGYPVLPGPALGEVIIFLLVAGGAWGLVAACLRFAFADSFARPMRNIVGALFSLYLASEFTRFYSREIRGSELVLAFFVGLAIVVIADGVISYLLPRRMGRREAQSD
ncbi:MAG TPA: zinc ribbon domain-containing protein [Nitrososphaerales archaeon]|nr:zinc ribbon domain-containing protein [Nitrososphaerales archaeon]